MTGSMLLLWDTGGSKDDSYKCRGCCPVFGDYGCFDPKVPPHPRSRVSLAWFAIGRDATSQFSTEALDRPLGGWERSWFLPVYLSGARRDEHKELGCLAWTYAALGNVRTLSDCYPHAVQSKAQPNFYQGISVR